MNCDDFGPSVRDFSENLVPGAVEESSLQASLLISVKARGHVTPPSSIT